MSRHELILADAGVAVSIRSEQSDSLGQDDQLLDEVQTVLDDGIGQLVSEVRKRFPQLIVRASS